MSTEPNFDLDDGIPDELLVKNRKPLSPELQAKQDARAKTVAEQTKNVHVLGKPKGMSVEEWEAHQASEAAKKAPKEKVVKVKAEKEADTFALKDWAVQNKLDPRRVRVVARANKAKLGPMSVAKHTFRNKDLSAVEAIIKAGLAAKGEAKPAGKARASKAKVTLPSGGVWSGKAKVTRTKGAPPKPSSAKAKLTAEAKKLSKGVKVKKG